MAANKQALIRHRIIDNCLSNPQKRYSFDDLLDCINKELQEINGANSGISIRTLRGDIQHLRSPEGGNAPIESYKKYGKSYVRYSDPEFKLYNKSLNAADIQQLKNALETLSKIEGLPQMGWVQELGTKLEETFFLEKTDQLIMSHDNNRYLKGIENLGRLFHAILNKSTLHIRYQSFKNEKETAFDISPYHLREYNNRWFLFGRNKGYPNLTNLALDRILSIDEGKHTYIENTEWNFEEYFEDIVGVSFESKSVEKIRLWFSPAAAPYVISKPLHGSLRKISNNETGLIIEIEVIPNFELETLILSYGEQTKVLSPESFRNKIKHRADAMMKNYLDTSNS
ncbi:WYL domain-containing protein [Sphingobacterium alkalisoli]|uniref:WYL domain-containing protein n=1 Tax=Sphingobacterium alkalisoli TaxID=1874115 RepID=A0A4U0H4Q9_9SPHI|nr:WYL domain-containing protein [Sphingobacterium alkalisoli]TJY66691.1 WYL domain-containing protein [Sphingobacterium alkalisoli]GGH14810.1 WYL domain-containing protein [Sphingobacterium alkalisoli]